MSPQRLRGAVRAAAVHLLGSIAVAVLAAVVVFACWYPSPFGEVAGGRELFFLVSGIDVICGPLLTLVVFNHAKPRAELVRDLGIVVLIQLAALSYGTWTAYQARPLFVVHELDRFKVVARVDVDPAAVANLAPALQPRIFGGPVLAGLRTPTKDERETVMFESVQGGRDYGERPEFYRVYDAEAKAVALKSGKSSAQYLQRVPRQKDALLAVATRNGVPLDDLRIVPVIARGDWIAILGPSGDVLDYLRGDAFF